MQEWQTKFMQSLIFFAIALVAVAGLCAAELWTFYDKTLALFQRNPVMALYSAGGLLFAIAACLGAAVFCLGIRRSMLRHTEKIKQLKDTIQ